MKMIKTLFILCFAFTVSAQGMSEGSHDGEDPCPTVENSNGSNPKTTTLVQEEPKKPANPDSADKDGN